MLEVQSIAFGYHRVPVLEGISLSVQPGEIVVVQGPSGCGKSTLLKLLLGVLKPWSGTVILDQVPLTHSADMAYISQDDSLFPWFTLEQNVQLGARMQALPLSERRSAVDSALATFDLTAVRGAYPNQLSGGQRQRGAIARALLNRPRVLLADEPFRSLDSVAGFAASAFLRSAAAEHRLGVLMVSHDMEASVFIADRILFLAGAPARVAQEYRVGLPRRREVSTRRTAQFAAELARAAEFFE